MNVINSMAHKESAEQWYIGTTQTLWFDCNIISSIDMRIAHICGFFLLFVVVVVRYYGSNRKKWRTRDDETFNGFHSNLPKTDSIYYYLFAACINFSFFFHHFNFNIGWLTQKCDGMRFKHKTEMIESLCFRHIKFETEWEEFSVRDIIK